MDSDSFVTESSSQLQLLGLLHAWQHCSSRSFISLGLFPSAAFQAPMKELCREMKPRNTDPSGSTSCDTWQGKCSRKKLVSRAVPSAAASNHQSCFFDVPGENDPLYKKRCRLPFQHSKEKISIQRHLYTANGRRDVTPLPWRQKCAIVITGEPGPSPLTIKEARLSSV